MNAKCCFERLQALLRTTALWSCFLPVAAALLVTPADSHASQTETFGGPGGNVFVGNCPSGMTMVGIQAATGAWVDSVAAVCGRIDPVTKRAQQPYWIHKPTGGRGGSTQQRFCDDGHPLTGLALTHTIGNGLERQYVNSIGLFCDRQDQIQQCIGSGEGCNIATKTTTTTAIVPISKTRKYKNDLLLCSKNEVALGLSGRSGAYVDALGLWCGPLPTPSTKR